ncbi:beta-phosphoglucomutase family hydrolase [Cellulomonas alba]|uniref:Beta-phosphoglucomutase family hydrolase n=1 Tax=Cellulomonas alba TaxID=3053467 RepID=A0ABT7SIH3_9CELL|nr:beta-phosphoglucomutase family hydrolase [Cellulomonas alba]MDM7855987.1 beta-phosphoglucomutase family hydrolase [Cellulomonas alba]
MPSPVSVQDYDAVLFDLDGVLTTTRTVHAAAWKRMFDEFLQQWDADHGTTSPHFDDRSDYAAYVDGKAREEGVRSFLASRGIVLPPGAPDAPPEEVSCWGLGNRKQLLVEDELERNGVEAFPGSVAWVRELREAGLRTAVVSSSRNCATVLEYAGIANLFDARVDGETILELGLPGKPAPDGFLEGARRLGVDPTRTVVVEDAIAGVEAGHAGGFGLVIGVDRDDHADELAARGADLVVADLAELVSDPEEDVHRAGPPSRRLVEAARRILSSSGDYPPDRWRIVERAYNPDFVPQTETLFALSNGYLGIRGAFEEGEPVSAPATLLNGFHETWPIVYPERAHGFASVGQTILPVPDGTTVRLLVDDDPVTCARTEVRTFERALDMRRGVVERTVEYQLRDGRRFLVRTQRLVSLVQRHLACLRYEITALDAPAHVVLSSELVTPLDDPAPEVSFDPRRTRPVDGALDLVHERRDGARVVRAYRTPSSGLTVAAGMDHDLDGGLAHLVTRVDGAGAHVVLEADLEVGVPVGFTKWLAYHYGSEDGPALADRAQLTLFRARRDGHVEVVAAHERAVAEFWARSEIVWDGSPMAQQAAHLNQFTLMQASLRSEGHGVPSKGLTGTGYEGHYFWDTEAYLLPFLIHTSPDVARSLLMHRIRMLPAARRRAAEVGCAGALFPWRTINGHEASAYYAAGTAQYHIDADVAYALHQYVEVTGDTDLLVRHGAELLVETARMWAALGFFSDRHDGRFVINRVTGPDEYSTVVDNNLFTNLMAAENLRIAADAVVRLRDEFPDDYARLVARVDLRDGEEAAWRRAAEQMHVPYDERAGVHMQDDGFLDQPPWDFAGTPADKYPLLLHFHPLVIYRHQVIKQADVVLATVLLPERFTAEERRRIFEYYDPLTTGDSSLSECIQAIAAIDVGKYRSGEEYLVDAAAIDIADRAGNLHDGVHVASAGGTWMAVVQGFAGYRWRGTRFAPMLPTRARRLRFPLTIRGSVLDVDIRPDEVTYSVRSGGPVTAHHHDVAFTVAPGAPVSFPGTYHTSDAGPDALDDGAVRTGVA